MVIVERPKEEGYFAKFIGGLVDLKLHEPHEFKVAISELKQNYTSLMFQKIIQSIDKLMTTEYKVRHFNDSGLDHFNSSNHVCHDNSKLEYRDQCEFLKFWLNRVGIVSISQTHEYSQSSGIVRK